MSLGIQMFTSHHTTPEQKKIAYVKAWEIFFFLKKGAVLGEMHIGSWMRILVMCVNSNYYT